MTATTLPSAYRAKVLNENWTNFSVLRHGAFDGVLVTSKNSGTHWLKYMLAVALAETLRDRATGVFLRECRAALYRLAEGCAGFPAASQSRFQPHDSAPPGGLGMGARLGQACPLCAGGPAPDVDPRQPPREMGIRYQGRLADLSGRGPGRIEDTAATSTGSPGSGTAGAKFWPVTESPSSWFIMRTR
jgi:hypothetical protein